MKHSSCFSHSFAVCHFCGWGWSHEEGERKKEVKKMDNIILVESNQQQQQIAIGSGRKYIFFLLVDLINEIRNYFGKPKARQIEYPFKIPTPFFYSFSIPHSPSLPVPWTFSVVWWENFSHFFSVFFFCDAAPTAPPATALSFVWWFLSFVFSYYFIIK